MDEGPLPTGPATKMPLNKTPLKFIMPEAKRPYPGDRSPQAAKDDCAATTPLTVLMPSFPNGRALNTWGLTTQERPLIWVYVPFGSEEKVERDGKMVQKYLFDVELRIKEEDDSPSLPTVSGKTPNSGLVLVKTPLPRKPQMISMSLPPNYKLEVGKNYRVSVSACNSQKANVWVQRVSLPRVGDVTTLPARDRIKTLAENGIWLDTLTEVVKLNAAPRLSDEWRSFVQESLGWDLQEQTARGRVEKAKVDLILKEPID